MYSEERKNVEKRAVRVEIEHHKHILETLEARLKELEKGDDRRRVENALRTIEIALSRDIPVPDNQYSDGVKDGIKMACEELKKVLLSE